MAPAAAPRKRIRKRKRRRDVSSSESSDPSDSSESDARLDVAAPKAKIPPPKTPQSSSSDSGSGSSSSSDDSDSDESVKESKTIPAITSTAAAEVITQSSKKATKKYVEAPPVPPASMPTILPKTLDSADGKEKEQQLKDKFRKFWMESMADGFADDLNQVRKESGLNKTRLELLIDSLAAGAYVYSSSSGSDGKANNEMEIVLGERS